MIIHKIVLAVLAAVMVAVGTTTVTIHADGPNDGSSRDDLNRELSLVESYVSYSDTGGYPIQTFDAEAALEAGISRATVDLVAEMVAYQNEMASQAFRLGVTNITLVNVNLSDYPRVKAYLEGPAVAVSTPVPPLSQGGVGGQSSDRGGNPRVPAGAHPCGNRDYPVPDFGPKRFGYSSDNPRAFFRANGYHLTLPYARGRDTKSRDYTLGRSYHGPYGECSSPRFRNHGIINTSGDGYSIQYGEPNPEVLDYWWPYFGWPSYVRWWHETY